MTEDIAPTDPSALTRYIETRPENYKGLEAAARSAGLL